jgi:hypothetical protein
LNLFCIKNPVAGVGSNQTHVNEFPRNGPEVKPDFQRSLTGIKLATAAREKKEPHIRWQGRRGLSRRSAAQADWTRWGRWFF